MYRVWSPLGFMELKRQFEALSGRYGELEGALAAEQAAREDVEQRLAQTEAKALQLGEEVTELRNSQQRFDISTRRASLVVQRPDWPGVTGRRRRGCLAAGLHQCGPPATHIQRGCQAGQATCRGWGWQAGQAKACAGQIWGGPAEA